MIRQVAVAASIALLGFSSQAMAGQMARLSSVQGSMLVNQNGRYTPVTSSTVLRSGDRLLAMNGDAKLTYADGCAVNVSARSMTTIGSQACGGDAKVTKASYQDDGMGGGGGYNNNDGWDFWVWAAFGVVTVTTVGIAMNNAKSPTSP